MYNAQGIFQHHFNVKKCTLYSIKYCNFYMLTAYFRGYLVLGKYSLKLKLFTKFSEKLLIWEKCLANSFFHFQPEWICQL